ncbi:hypothetical protein OCU04_009876 [Sclerotinia nivalis]|uniref:Uncharacterized protein n=1 Tax=Sclerotinia nivalis TaxID=352851 RepID=A0A9X0DHR2_9HELO|nr:hypothetical protein OCU04_009876 [Sclerotinia nivalis]
MQIWKATLGMSLEGFVNEVQGMYGQKDESRISAWSQAPDRWKWRKVLKRRTEAMLKGPM